MAWHRGGLKALGRAGSGGQRSRILSATAGGIGVGALGTSMCRPCASRRHRTSAAPPSNSTDAISPGSCAEPDASVLMCSAPSGHASAMA